MSTLNRIEVILKYDDGDRVLAFNELISAEPGRPEITRAQNVKETTEALSMREATRAFMFLRNVLVNYLPIPAGRLHKELDHALMREAVVEAEKPTAGNIDTCGATADSVVAVGSQDIKRLPEDAL